jgi:hypothetical protein
MQGRGRGLDIKYICMYNIKHHTNKKCIMDIWGVSKRALQL